MAQAITFIAKIEKSEGAGGWHYVHIHDEVREHLRKYSGKNGNVAVLVTIGKTTWPSTTMSMGQQRWFVAVKSEVRKAEAVAEGDVVSITIAPDAKRL